MAVGRSDHLTPQGSQFEPAGSAAASVRADRQVPGHAVIRSVNHVTSAVMATVTRTYQVDDLDGSADDVSAVRFHLDKKDYDIDLSAANEERLRRNWPSSWTRPPRRATACSDHRRTQDRQGHPCEPRSNSGDRGGARGAEYVVSERGRIPKNVQEAFDQAH